jgi:hypothetical protein
LSGLLPALVARLPTFGFPVPVLLARRLLGALILLALLRALLTGVVVHVVVLSHAVFLRDAWIKRSGAPPVSILNMHFIQ